MARTKVSTNSIKQSEISRKYTDIKAVDERINELKEELDLLQEHKKELVFNKNKSALLELNELIEEKGFSITQIKSLLKENDAQPKKKRGRKKKEEEQTVQNLIEEIVNNE